MTLTQLEVGTVLDLMRDAENTMEDRNAREPLVSRIEVRTSEGSHIGDIVLDATKDQAEYTFEVAE